MTDDQHRQTPYPYLPQLLSQLPPLIKNFLLQFQAIRPVACEQLVFAACARQNSEGDRCEEEVLLQPLAYSTGLRRSGS